MPAPLYDAMIAHARAELPNECCGLLAGRISDDGLGAEVVERYPIINELKSPKEFLTDARDMLNAERNMRVKGTRTLAIYHSHPTSEPKPSKRDLEQYDWPNVMFIIVSLAKEPAEIRAWWLIGTKFEEARMEVFFNPQSEIHNPK
jgi:proteasome lid subunit RPN8/RPN11